MKVLDLCSGAAGGWSLGLHRAGMTTVAACEAVAWRRAAYAQNNPGVKLYDDLRTLTGADLERDQVRGVNLVCGSPPCKEYSSVGSGRGLDADDLFLHAVRIVGDVGPRWVALENSDRVKTRGYDRIAAALEALGYTCWPLVVGAGNAGAAHRRARVFILACNPSRPQGRLARQPRADSGVGRPADAGEATSWCNGPGPHQLLVGPAGSQPLGRHLRAYDGVPAGVAELAREAYGDTVLPQLTEAVGRAIISAEQAGVL